MFIRSRDVLPCIKVRCFYNIVLIKRCIKGYPYFLVKGCHLVAAPNVVALAPQVPEAPEVISGVDTHNFLVINIRAKEGGREGGIVESKAGIP